MRVRASAALGHIGFRKGLGTILSTARSHRKHGASRFGDRVLREAKASVLKLRERAGIEVARLVAETNPKP